MLQLMTGPLQSMLSILLLVVVTTVTTAQLCPGHTFCGSTLDIRFPFGIQTQTSQPENNCTYPGFNLSCQTNKTLLNSLTPTLHLPNAGNFTVQSINYVYQQLFISDPNHCLPSRMSRFNLSSSPFSTVLELQNFVLLSCPHEKVPSGFWILTCLSNDSSTIIGLREGNEGSAPKGCVEMERVRVPGGWADGLSSGGMWLQWDLPDCRACEAEDGLCGFRASAGLEVGCLDVPTNSNEGLSKTLNFALGFGIPAVCILAFLYCICCKKKSDTPHGHLAPLELPSTAVAPQPQVVNGGRGHNQPSIEPYDQRKRSPKPSEDDTCTICLSKYRVKEVIRTLPECNHRFHTDCIDEWLKINKTCPVCRVVTPDRMSSSSQSKKGSH